MSAVLDRAEGTLHDLEAAGWVVSLEPGSSDALCHAFDEGPDAPGFVALVQATRKHGTTLEVGRGCGEPDEDRGAARVVVAALARAGLLGVTQRIEDRVYVTVRLAYRVGTLREAGLEARWGRTHTGAPVLCARDPDGTYAHQRERWWRVDRGMWRAMEHLGVREGFASCTELGDVFSIGGGA
jgi:hypothetical protein